VTAFYKYGRVAALWDGSELPGGRSFAVFGWAEDLGFFYLQVLTSSLRLTYSVERRGIPI
jgi:hypothetical protein